MARNIDLEPPRATEKQLHWKTHFSFHVSNGRSPHMFAFKSSELRVSNPPSSTLIFHRKSKRMNVNQRQERIRKAASDLDIAIESNDVERVVECFADDCEIELLGITLRGKDGVRKWMGWLYRYLDRIRLVPVTTFHHLPCYGFSSKILDAPLHRSQHSSFSSPQCTSSIQNPRSPKPQMPFLVAFSSCES